MTGFIRRDRLFEQGELRPVRRLRGSANRPSRASIGATMRNTTKAAFRRMGRVQAPFLFPFCGHKFLPPARNFMAERRRKVRKMGPHGVTRVLFWISAHARSSTEFVLIPSLAMVPMNGVVLSNQFTYVDWMTPQFFL